MIVKKLLPASIAAATLAAGMTFSTTASAAGELSAGVGVASSYLWRGYDLGAGTPAVSGDLTYSISGLHVGTWVSSGDLNAGTEYDLILGYGGEAGDFNYDITLVNYVYPTGGLGPGYVADGEADIGDFSDAILTLGYGPVSFSWYKPVGDGSGGDYTYYSLSAGFGQFSALVGMHKDNGDCPADVDTGAGETCDSVHLDLSYAYNDNLSFTLSQFVADEPVNDDLKMVVSYSIPIQ